MSWGEMADPERRDLVRWALDQIMRRPFDESPLMFFMMLAYFWLLIHDKPYFDASRQMGRSMRETLDKGLIDFLKRKGVIS